MQAEAGQARGQVESMMGQPDDLNARSAQLDELGASLIASSFDLEAQLQATQTSYAESMRSVPPLEPWEGEIPEEAASGILQAQRTDEGATEEQSGDAGPVHAIGGEETSGAVVAEAGRRPNHKRPVWRRACAHNNRCDRTFDQWRKSRDLCHNTGRRRTRRQCYCGCAGRCRGRADI